MDIHACKEPVSRGETASQRVRRRWLILEFAHCRRVLPGLARTILIYQQQRLIETDAISSVEQFGALARTSGTCLDRSPLRTRDGDHLCRVPEVLDYEKFIVGKDLPGSVPIANTRWGPPMSSPGGPRLRKIRRVSRRA